MCWCGCGCGCHKIPTSFSFYKEVVNVDPEKEGTGCNPRNKIIYKLEVIIGKKVEIVICSSKGMGQS